MRRGWFSRPSLLGPIYLALSLIPTTVHAGRPYITDDAAVVGRATLQLECWGHLHGKTGDVFTTLALGPIDELELSIAGMWGVGEHRDVDHMSLTGPTLQLKLLGRAPDAGGLPGVASAIGLVPPVGMGPLAPDASFYTYLAITESPLGSEALHLHLNAGLVSTFAADGEKHGPSWSVAAGYAVVEPLVVFAEVVSSDPLLEPTAAAGHAGLSYAFSDFFAADLTAGTQLWGASTIGTFATIGVVLVSSPLW